MKLDQQRGDVAYLRTCQIKESMAGIADRYEEVIDQLEQAEERCSDLSSKLIEARVFITGLGDEIRDHIQAVLRDAKGERYEM